MKGAVIAFALGLCALPARGDAPGDPQTLHFVLTSIDAAPLRQDLIDVTGTPDEALRSLRCLVDVATPGAQCPVPPTEPDPALQLRAIRALPQFCPRDGTACAGTPAHVTLVNVITAVARTPSSTHTGLTILRLRAGIEALGVAHAGADADITLLLPLLDHPSRDIRAATARALRDLCAKRAAAQLRSRLQQEQIEQVRLAISEALRDLDACPASRSAAGQP